MASGPLPTVRDAPTGGPRWVVRGEREAVAVSVLLMKTASVVAVAADEQSDTVWDVLGKFGLGAIIGGAVVAALSGLLTSRRERTAARRQWLDQALASFYAPVSTKLEVMHLRSEELLEEVRTVRKREAEADEPPVFPTWHDKMLQRLARESIDSTAALARVIESNLQYVASAELREAAVDYLAAEQLNEWRRDLAGSRERLAQGHGLVLIPDEKEERPRFHRLVRDEFERLGAEFRRLSGSRD